MADNRQKLEQTQNNLTRSDIKRVSETILLQTISVNDKAKKDKSANASMRNLIILLSVVAVIILVLMFQMIITN